MRILISGSSGQIGTGLAMACLARGDTVQGVDIRLNPWSDRIPTLLADLSKLAVVAGGDKIDNPLTALDRPDVVVHLAAHAKVHDSVIDPGMAMANLQMLYGVLEYCRRQGLPLIFASSREVYGDGEDAPRSEQPVDHHLAASPYAATKLAGESLIQAYRRCYGLRHLIVRLSNVYGRYDNDLERLERVVPLFMKRIAADLPVEIYGAGKILDFTHIDDCVAALLAALDKLAIGEDFSGAINISGGSGHSLIELAGLLGELLSRQPLISELPMRPGEIAHYRADLTRARALLGYRPTVTLREGLALSLRWQAGNPRS